MSSQTPGATDPAVDPAVVLQEKILGRPVTGWFTLLYASGMSAWFSIYHTIHAGGMPLDLAVAAGIFPSALALLISHLVADEVEALWIQLTGFAVMLAVMALSLRAVGETVHPAEGALWWLFGPAADVAELLALYLVIKRTKDRAAQRKRMRIAVAAQRAAEAAAQQAAAERAAQIQARLAARADRAPEQDADTPRTATRGTRPDKNAQAESARREYLKSVMNRSPLSERDLAAKFPPRSRTWAKARMDEVRAQRPELFEATG